MTYWILPQSCIPISCGTVQKLTEIEKQKDEYKEKMTNFNEKIKKRLEAKTVLYILLDKSCYFCT